MAAQAPVPIYTSLDQVFPDPSVLLQQGARYNELAEAFESHFGKRPTYIVRAPGRVNLIGDHIDYCLFGVLPAAVERDILMAIGPRDIDDVGRVTAQNMDSKYTRQTFAPVKDTRGQWSLDIDKTQLRWESYVKAGYYGVLEKFFKDNEEVPHPVDLLVIGSVPAGSGLSSSAAMVVASTLSFLSINDKLEGLSKGDVVEMAIKNETRVGVNSGGMDQSASVISGAEAALYITFHPHLFAEPIPLPVTFPRTVFVCANSLVVSDKVVHSRTRYNLRAFESLVAARVLAHQLSVEIGAKEKLTLKEFLDRWLGVPEGKVIDSEELKKGLENIADHLDVLKLVKSDGSDGTQVGVLLDEMIKLSGMSSEDFGQVYLSWANVEATHFQLYKRAKHVFSESLRVLQFREVCLRATLASSQEASDSKETLRELGSLMDESQKSCSELCESSCPEVDLLCHLAKEAGAYGSRVTGAGWGGCTVSLVEEARVPEFVEKLRTSYPPYHGLKGEELSEIVFATKPSSGAGVFKLQAPSAKPSHMIRVKRPSSRPYRSSVGVDDLPTEILREIFIRTYPSEIFKPDSAIDPGETIALPRRLSHVSRRWREVAISFGELWSYLSLYVGSEIIRKPESILELFLTFLERTNTYPINFRFRFFFSGTLNEEARSAIEYMIEALLEHQKQWKDVEFIWCGLRLSPGFQGLNMVNMPLLKTLSLKILLKSYCGEDYFASIDVSRSSRIESMEVEGCFYLQDAGPPIFGPVKCVLTPSDRLSDATTASMCLKMLTLAPNLQTMKIYSTKPLFPSKKYHIPSTPEMHHLTNLSLRCGFASEMVIDSLVLPKLRKLLYYDGNLQFGGQAMIRLIQRSHPPLTSLALRGIHVLDSDTIELLRLLPTIVELDIASCPATASLFRALDIQYRAGAPHISPANDDSILCPRLRSLRLQRVPVYQPTEIITCALISMIDSRIRFMRTLNHAVVRTTIAYPELSLANRDYELVKKCFQFGGPVFITTEGD